MENHVSCARLGMAQSCQRLVETDLTRDLLGSCGRNGMCLMRMMHDLQLRNTLEVESVISLATFLRLTAHTFPAESFADFQSSSRTIIEVEFVQNIIWVMVPNTTIFTEERF